MAPPHKRRKRHKTRRPTPPTGRGGRYIEGEDGRPQFEPPAPPSGGTGGGTGGVPPVDLFGIPGLPPEVQSRMDAILRDGRANPEERALAYLMTTPWFKQEYKGYEEGYAKGKFADPLGGGLAQYRAYKTDVNRSYAQYYGRAATQDEVASYITLGYDSGQVEQVGQGFAYVQANKGDIQYLAGAFGGGALSEAELTAYGQEQAGLNSELGAKLSARFQSALQKSQRVFQGMLGESATASQSLSKVLQQRQRSDIGA